MSHINIINMKKLTTLLTIIIVATSLFAEIRTPQEAQAIADRTASVSLKSPNKKSRTTQQIKTSLVLTINNETTQDASLYVFNKGNNSGYVIVSADTRAEEILAYADNGSFNPNNIPPNMKEWLDVYAAELGVLGTLSDEEFYANASPSKPILAKNLNADDFPTSVAPLLGNTIWNQGEPFNNLCPLDGGGERSVTGCVATAMAQIMYYHKWPFAGTGSHSYITDTDRFRVGTTFEGFEYDWANMIDYYDRYSTSVEEQAVAELMFHCGVSVEMDYTSDMSGAYSSMVDDALVDYFGYSTDISFERKTGYYSNQEWEDLFKSELSNGRPIYHSGAGEGGAHAFVCDGYNSNDYFHFNWGWGGSENGYFLLSALNPEIGGIGSGDGGGFNEQRQIVVGIEPPEGARPILGKMSGDIETNVNNFDISFQGWVQHDLDGAKTYGFESENFRNENYIGSFIAMNPSATEPTLKNMIPPSGERYLGCVSAIPSDFTNGDTCNNDWLIAPLSGIINNNSKFCATVRSHNDTYGLDRYVIHVSTSGTDVEDFTKISPNEYEAAPEAWTPIEYDLSAYEGKQIYVAVQCVSKDALCFCIDDIRITNSTHSYTLMLDPNGGSVDVPHVATKTDSVIGHLPTPERANYSFVEWQIDGDAIDSSTVWTYDMDKTAKAVWQFSDEQTYIDTDTIFPETPEHMTLYSFENGGYMTGHNAYIWNQYAERFSLSQAATLNGFLYFPMIIQNHSGEGRVTFKVWSVENNFPGDVLASVTIDMADMIASDGGVLKDNNISLPTPIADIKDFYCGFEIDYNGLNPVDTFAHVQASNRIGHNIDNTLFIYEDAWYDVSELLVGGISTGLFIGARINSIQGKTYTLTLDPTGGFLLDQTKLVSKGIAIGSLPRPTRYKYDFVEWRIDGNKISNSTIWDFDEDKTAVAIWRQTPTGVDNVADNVELSIFPNPVSEMIYIKCQLEMQEIGIFDIMGNQVETHITDDDDVSLNVGGLPSGTYVLQIMCSDGTRLTRKFVKI